MLLAPIVSAADPITHSLLITGAETAIRAGDGTVTWKYPHNTRDGWVLPNGNVLLTLSKSKAYPSGGVIEVTKDGKIVFEYKGSQAEVNTAQLVADDRVMLTEAGPKPRLIEVTKDGKVVVDVPLTAQTKDLHMQSRMARKLPNGNYLVPQLLDRVVREYTPAGKVAWEVATPHMPFTAIRLPDGNTLIACTHGNLVVEVDKDGKEVWRLSNDDLPGKPLADCCGAQRLPNGNTVVTCYAAKGDNPRVIEVTRDKKIVWEYRNAKAPGVHHFQVLDTNGSPVAGPPLR